MLKSERIEKFCKCGKPAEIAVYKKDGKILVCFTCFKKRFPEEFLDWKKSHSSGEFKLKNGGELFSSKSLVEAPLKPTFKDFGKKWKLSPTENSAGLNFAVKLFIESIGEKEFFSLASRERLQHGTEVLSVIFPFWIDQTKEVKYVFSLMHEPLWIENPENGKKIYC